MGAISSSHVDANSTRRKTPGKQGPGEDYRGSLSDAAKVPDSVPGLAISDLKKAIGYVGDYKRFLYGTDWPLAPMGCYRQLIELLIPKAHHQEVFRTNAQHVFSL